MIGEWMKVENYSSLVCRVFQSWSSTQASSFYGYDNLRYLSVLAGSNHSPIYLDYNATTTIDKRVGEAMIPYITEHFGNPSRCSYCRYCVFLCSCINWSCAWKAFAILFWERSWCGTSENFGKLLLRQLDASPAGCSVLDYWLCLVFLILANRPWRGIDDLAQSWRVHEL